MPMNKSLYPKNWDVIAHSIKTADQLSAHSPKGKYSPDSDNSCSAIGRSPNGKDCSTRISRKLDEVKVSPTDDKQPPQSDVQRLQAEINKLKATARHAAQRRINETAPQLRTHSKRYQKMLAEFEAEELEKRQGQIQTLEKKLQRLNSIRDKRSSTSIGSDPDSLNATNPAESDSLNAISSAKPDGWETVMPAEPDGWEGFGRSSKEKAADSHPQLDGATIPSASQIQTIRVEQKTADGQAENSHSNQAKMSSTKPFQTIRVEQEAVDGRASELVSDALHVDSPPDGVQMPSASQIQTIRVEQGMVEGGEAQTHSTKPLQTIRVEQKTVDGGAVDSPTDVVESPSTKPFQTIRVEHQPETETAKYPRARNTKPGRGLRPKQVNCNIRRNNTKGKKPDCYWVYKFSFKVDGKYFNRSCSIPKEKVNRVIEMWESEQYSWREIVEFIGKNPDKIVDKVRKKKN